MSSQPTVVFLHGVGQHARTQGWRQALERGLQAAGYAEEQVDRLTVLSPRYGDLLASNEEPEGSMPPRQKVRPPPPAVRAAYEQSQARLRRVVGHDPDDLRAGVFGSVPDWMTDGAAEAMMWVDDELAEAGRYIESSKLRAAVLSRVVGVLPSAPGSQLVLIGHSLGSLVAIDLLDQLDGSLSVVRLVTLGSPAGIRAMHKGSDRLLKTFPYSTVQSWLNVVSTGDPVCAGRGLSGHFPAAQDVFVDLGAWEHDERSYLLEPVVALAVGDAVIGSLSQELVPARKAVELALTAGEQAAIFSLYFAHETLEKLRDDDAARAERYEAALRMMQVEMSRRLGKVAVEEGRPVSDQVAALADGEPPRCPQVWGLDEVVRLLVVAGTTNLVSPVEIDARAASLAALRPAAAALGFGSSRGRTVADSITSARKGLGLDETDWGRVALGAVGVALLVGATGGLMAAAAPGLVGAAAITSALAGFGPGGMVGGMVMAGTMIGTGSVASAAAALGGADVETVETEVLRRMAHARSRKQLGLPRDPTDWLLLTELESQVSRRLDSIESLSDDGGVFGDRAPSINHLRRKRDQVRRAIAWMVRHDLGPPILRAG